MANNKKKGYMAGLACLFFAVIFLIAAFSSGWNLTGQIFSAFTVIFSGLGVGSLFKPESVGIAVLNWIGRFGEEKTTAQKKSVKQVQKDSGVQVIGDNANISYINVHGQTINDEVEKKDFTQKADEKNYGEAKNKADKSEYKLIQLPDANVTKLGLNNEILSTFYDEGIIQAREIFSDASLAQINIHMYPLTPCLPKFRISLYFYSKNTDKRTQFVADEEDKKMTNFPPIRRAKYDNERMTFSNVPWKDNPHWVEFINKAYEQVKPLFLYEHSDYVINIEPDGWFVYFDNAVEGEKIAFKWNGKGLDKDSITRIL